jgi:hypothetical protein
MKQQINEFKRMQLIAGLITESEYRQSLSEEMELPKVGDRFSYEGDEIQITGVDDKFVDAKSTKKDKTYNFGLRSWKEGFKGSKLNEMDEAVSYYGDINNLDKPESPEKEEAMAYLETPEGMNAVNILKNLVNSESFDLNELGKAIKKCDFKKTNHFRVAAKKAGLDLEGLGTLDNSGNGDFAVRNRNYKDKGYAVVFFNDKFERVG